MALPTNTFATYEAVGNREDLSDVIYRIDPTDTPFMTGVERTKATAVNHEWQTQALAAVDTGNYVLEGDDATTDAATPTVRLGNVCQISDKVARVTGTQQAVRARRPRRRARLSGDAQGPRAQARHGDAPGRRQQGQGHRARYSTARKTASILSWIKSNTSKGAGGADPAAADGTGTRTDGTQRAFTEANLKAVLQSDLEQRRQARHHHAGRLQQAGDSRPSPAAPPRSRRPSRRRSSRRSTPTSPTSAPSRWCPTASSARATCWCWRWTSGRSPISTAARCSRSRSPRPANSDRRQMLSEYALEARNEKASGGVFDNTTS